MLAEADSSTSSVLLSDELEFLSTIRAGAKVKGLVFALAPMDIRGS